MERAIKTLVVYGALLGVQEKICELWIHMSQSSNDSSLNHSPSAPFLSCTNFTQFDHIWFTLRIIKVLSKSLVGTVTSPPISKGKELHQLNGRAPFWGHLLPRKGLPCGGIRHGAKRGDPTGGGQCWAAATSSGFAKVQHTGPLLETPYCLMCEMKISDRLGCFLLLLLVSLDEVTQLEWLRGSCFQYKYHYIDM